MTAPATHSIKRAPATILAVVLSLAIACPLWADETLKITPSISARETYDTNVNLAGKGDFEHSVTPGIRVDLQKERVRGWVQAKGMAYKYSKLNEFDRIDQNYDAGFEVNATEKLSMAIKANVLADHAFTSSLAGTGELSKSTPHQSYSVSPSITFGLNESNALTLFHAFTKDVYGSEDYSDVVTNALGGLWGHRLNERTQLLFQVAGARAETKTVEQNSVTGMAGFEYALAETVKARVLAGVGSMRTTAQGLESTSARTFAADTSLEWRLEKIALTGGYSRDMTLGLTGEDLIRNKFNLGLTYDLTERTQMLLNSSFVISKTPSDALSPVNDRWMDFQPSLKYLLGENSSVSLGYGYSASKDSINDVLLTGSRVFLDFSIAFP